MIAHTTLAVADCERATTFYLKALAPLGYRKNMDFGADCALINKERRSLGMPPLDTA